MLVIAFHQIKFTRELEYEAGAYIASQGLLYNMSQLFMIDYRTVAIKSVQISGYLLYGFHDS